MSIEWVVSNHAVNAASGECTGVTTSWLGQPATAAKDPLFFLLYANTDRLWAMWQRHYSLSDPALANAYGAPACGLPAGQCLRNPMWPWKDPNAPGGPFPVGVISSYLQPPDQPTPADAIGLDHTVTWNATSGQWLRLPTGLGYSYDDVPPAP
ncbi:MAG: tyrosinase family protein [Sphingomonas sp.]